MELKDGIIYIIKDNTGKHNPYIGSTMRKLKTRISQHISSFNRWKRTGCNGCRSYLILNEGDYSFDILERVKVKDIKELRILEGKYQKCRDCINRNIAGRTKAQYYRDNREDKLRYQKEYNKKNKVKYDAYQKKYRERNRKRNQ
jgi:hypothetical protein